MRFFFHCILYVLVRFSLWLRYRISVEGLETLTSEKLKKPGGILFLSNHPAETDSLILLRILWPRFRPHPVAVDALFQSSIVRFFLNQVGALPVPNFEDSSNSFKRLQIDATYKRLYQILQSKGNLLIYPSGCLKKQAKEIIGGASGIHQILQECPDTNVVLINVMGLWGSSFSRALTGKAPALIPTFFQGLKTLLKNGIFFSPRRKVTITLEPALDDFPFQGSRLEINRYLEEWYNREGLEPLSLVSYSLWREDLAKVTAKPSEEALTYEAVPPEIQNRVIEELAPLTKLPQEQIAPSLELAQDLGLDSLDMAQIVVALKENFGITNVRSSDLTTVGSIMLFAARLKEGEEEEEEEDSLRQWKQEEGRPSAFIPEGKTLIEAFLKTCDRMGDLPACVDPTAGEVSYRKMKLTIIALARAIKRIPGERIGIMLPASVGVNCAILAVLLARKVPVMINWTLGARNLLSIVEQANIQTTLSSWTFLDRLENVELDGVDSQILLLEDVKREMRLSDKLFALFYSRRKTPTLLLRFGVHRLKEEDPAAILFTSGTESFPKGVPLSHKNILSNQRAAFSRVNITDQDILLGVLPPFHSFGFSVTSLFPLLAGLRVAFLPNPTEGRRIAKGIEKWKVTLACMAPTFLKNLLRVASSEQLSSLRLLVAGAERTPPELFEKAAEICPQAKLIEGYGITECAPILTLNPIDQPSKGVGIPLPDVELCIVHPETHAPLPQEEDGLILARGPNIFSGYLNPKLASPFLQHQGNEWYITGDLGSLDAHSYLVLTGRLKRFVKIGGEMISLTAIEETLLQAAPQKGWQLLPDVPSLAVSALEEGTRKSEIHLFTTFPTTPAEVNQTLRESGMSNLIKISSVHQLPTIPLLGTGKIDYHILQQKLSK